MNMTSNVMIIITQIQLLESMKQQIMTNTMIAEIIISECTYVSAMASARIGPVPPVPRHCVEGVQRKERAGVLL
jgi:hypothetical protein